MDWWGRLPAGCDVARHWHGWRTYFVGQDQHVYNRASLPIKVGKP